MARIIIDVRSAAEYSNGHVARSRNLPLGQLRSKISKYAQRLDEIWVCCASGSRSGTARKQLLEMGYKRVKDIGPWTNLK